MTCTQGCLSVRIADPACGTTPTIRQAVVPWSCARHGSGAVLASPFVMMTGAHPGG